MNDVWRHRPCAIFPAVFERRSLCLHICGKSLPQPQIDFSVVPLQQLLLVRGAQEAL
jgi:hypothetical protein